jgi:Family of unknown function (DUF6283)
VKKPCNNCPWRRDAPREHWDPQHFRDIWTNCQDDGMNSMLCHKATALPAEERNGLVCQGWIRVMGCNAIGVRIASMTGKVSLEEIEDREGLDLFDSFEDMLRANRVKLPKRNKFRR